MRKKSYGALVLVFSKLAFQGGGHMKAMHFITAAAAAIAIGLCSASAQTQPVLDHAAALGQPAHYNSLGYGMNDCSEFVATYEPGSVSKTFAWSTGFFTGFNAAMMTSGGRNRDLSGLTPHLVVTRLLDYCARNPQALIMEGVRDIYLRAPIFSYPSASAATPPVGK